VRSSYAFNSACAAGSSYESSFIGRPDQVVGQIPGGWTYDSRPGRMGRR
jgi:hypothetical protein